ncbi:MAG: hypothetical protein SO253_01035 [Bacilli bacterium]|nr:hypothetical protein [Bacilli bacterium]
MCEYIHKKELKDKKELFLEWSNEVRKELKTRGYRFDCILIGSGSRNMVVKMCNKDYYDLDYQIIVTKIPHTYDWNKDVKKIKNDFKNAFDQTKPNDFSFCEDSTQALQTKSKIRRYGYDIIITTFDEERDFYILYNKKNTNEANNNDYSWEPRKKMNKYKNNLSKISGAKMWNYLRKKYLEKRHNNKDNQNPNRKKAYQLFNEAVYETLKYFGEL